MTDPADQNTKHRFITTKNKQRLLLCLGFGFLWSMTKGMMNTGVFVYPDATMRIDPLFLIYLLSSATSSALVVFNIRTRGWILKSGFLIPAISFALGLTFFASQSQIALKITGSVICAAAMSVLLLKWAQAFTARIPSDLMVDIPLSFLIGTTLAWVYTLVGNQTALYLYNIVPFLSAAAYASLPRRSETQGHTGGFTKHTLRGILSHSRNLLAPFIVFFSISLISIAVSYLFLTKSPIPGDRQVYLHLVAPTLGSLVALLVRNTLKKQVNVFLLVLLPVIATLLLALPIFGFGYVLLVKGLLMALVEYLLILSLYLTLDNMSDRMDDAFVLAAALFTLLGLSTLLGLLSGFVFPYIGFDGNSLLLVMGMFSVYLLLLVFFAFTFNRKGIPLSRKSADESAARATDNEAFDALCTQYQLTAREAEVLKYLALGRSTKRIAETLILSQETVKGHTKNIYRKMNTHSKQQLLDIMQDAIFGKGETIPPKSG